jgi:hypothetical protein
LFVARKTVDDQFLQFVKLGVQLGIKSGNLGIEIGNLDSQFVHHLQLRQWQQLIAICLVVIILWSSNASKKFVYYDCQQLYLGVELFFCSFLEKIHDALKQLVSQRVTQMSVAATKFVRFVTWATISNTAIKFYSTTQIDVTRMSKVHRCNIVTTRNGSRFDFLGACILEHHTIPSRFCNGRIFGGKRGGVLACDKVQ